MTNIEFLRSADEEKLADFLCWTVQGDHDDCEKCPFYRLCERGTKGSKVWLEQEVEAWVKRL